MIGRIEALLWTDSLLNVQRPWGTANFSVGPTGRHHFVLLAMLRAD
jgi:hypothetical protein